MSSKEKRSRSWVVPVLFTAARPAVFSSPVYQPPTSAEWEQTMSDHPALAEHDIAAVMKRAGLAPKSGGE